MEGVATGTSNASQSRAAPAPTSVKSSATNQPASSSSKKSQKPKNSSGQKKKEPVASTSAPTETPSNGVGGPNAKKKRKKKEKSERGGGEGRGGGAGGGGGTEDPVGKLKLRVVVRRLPPNVPKSVFWKAVSPWVKGPQTLVGGDGNNQVDESLFNVDHAYFVQGKLKDGSRRGVNAETGVSPHIFSRAYLRFKSMDSLIEFHRGFDGHLFKDSKGNEYIAIVEFAPFQRTPNDLAKRRKPDPRQDTIEEDSDYKAFLVSLEKKKAEDDGQTQSEKTDAQLMSQLTQSHANNSNNSERAKHTPLLDHLRAQRTARAESSALKNARSYLNRSNNALAATAAAKEKGKTKKGQQAVGVSKDATIPTGPKASRRTDGQGQPKEKGPKKQQQAAVTKSETTAPSKDASTNQKGQGKRSKGNGSKSQSKVVEGGGAPATPKLSILTKQDGIVSAPPNKPVPTGPASERGAGSTERGGSSRGRGRGSRGRGRGAPTGVGVASGDGERK